MGEDCGNHHSSCCGCSGCSGCSDCWDGWRRKLLIAACVVGGVIVLVGFIVLVIYLVLRPTKPSFYLKDVTVYQFNLSIPDNLLSTVVQATVSTHNSNGRIGVYYDRVDVFAGYQDQQITLPSAIFPFYQGHDDVDVWSPYLYGATVPVSPYLCGSLQQDEAAGVLLLYIKIDGGIRWKVGTWTSGHYRLDVTCPAYFSFHNTSSGAPALQFQSVTPCSASV